MLNLFEKNPPLGIDISDYSVEILQLNERKEVLAYGRKMLGEGVVEKGKVINKKRLAEKIKEALKESKLSEAQVSRGLEGILSLPETRTFIHYFELPKELEGKELEKRILEESSRIIPFPPEEICWGYEVVPSGEIGLIPGGKRFKGILYAGVLKEIKEGYVEALERAGIKPVIFDIESASLGRSLLKESFWKSSGSMIVDIGAETTILGIFNNRNNLLFSVTLAFGGNNLTEEIIKSLEKKREEAELLKREIGLDPNRSKEVALVLREALKKVVREIKKAIMYTEEKIGVKIGRLVLAGGSTLLPRLDEYFESCCQRETIIQNPIIKIKDPRKALKEKNDLFFFTNVIGLALRGKEEKGINLLKSVG